MNFLRQNFNSYTALSKAGIYPLLRNDKL